METRYGVNEKGKPKQYVHMLNATLTATERTICCLLENYQTDEGVLVPEALQPYMGGMKIMPFVKDKPVNRVTALLLQLSFCFFPLEFVSVRSC